LVPVSSPRSRSNLTSRRLKKSAAICALFVIISNMSVIKETSTAERPRAPETPVNTGEFQGDSPELVLTIVRAIDTARRRSIERGIVGYDEDAGKLVELVEDDPNMRLISIEQTAGTDDAGVVLGSTRWAYIDAIHE